MPKPRSRIESLLWRDIALLLTAIFALFGCSQKNDPVLFGQVAPLTGPNRERGQASMHGVQMAVEELNADSAKWINGRKVAVIHADSHSDDMKAADQTVRLITVNRVSALLDGGTRSETDAMAAVVHSYTLPSEYTAIVVGTAGSVGTPPVREAFSLGVSPGQRAKIIDQLLSETLKPAKVALITNSADPSRAVITDKLTKLLIDRKSAFETLTYAKTDELSGLSQQFATSAPTIVFLGSAKDAISLRQSLEPPPTMIFAGDEIDAQQLVESVKDDNGPYYVGAYSRESVVSDFKTKFTDRFRSPPSIEAMMSYDAARVVFAASREAKSVAATKLALQFRKPQQFDTLVGPIEFGKDEQFARGPAIVFQARKGQAVIVKKVEAEKP